MLCDKCTPMFQSPEWGSHHPDAASLTEAAESGCYICKPLLHWVLTESGEPQIAFAEPSTYRVYQIPGPQSYAQVLVDFSILNNDGAEWKTCRCFSAIPKSELAADLSIRDREETLPLPQATQTAQKWMNDCLAGHEKCQKNTEPVSYPTRLIELGESTLRVVLTEEEKPSGPYASLSYVWGANPSFLCLTDANLPRLQAGIPYSDLPTAFREAIDFAKNLSIRYLWIDSFCIIQPRSGNFDDWHSESAKMQEVYSNSVLNMSLSRAINPSESCINGPPLSAVTMPFELETRGLFEGDNGHVNRTCIVVAIDHYREALYNQPLGFRAWGLQERLLAARVLSFGQGELFWDCLQMSGASESFPAGVAAVSDLIGIPDKTITGTKDSKNLSMIWDRVLKEYSQRDLTSPESDKLVAISAIAKQMAKEMDDVYIAGHFWKLLPLSLDWQMEPGLAQGHRRRDPTRRRINGLATEGDNQGHTPSWSWASMDGEVFLPFRVQKDYISLAEADSFALKPVDEANAEGQIASASLKVSAYWAEVQWEEDSTTIDSPEAWKDKFHHLYIIFDDPKDTPVGRDRFLLAAIAEDGWLCVWSGLVLKELEMDGEKVYERVAHFTLHDIYQRKSDNNIWRTEMRPLFKPEKKIFTLV
ncbi:Fc.00g114770.m01.CDS01 [Cosmosporella sp. VM-42]